MQAAVHGFIFILFNAYILYIHAVVCTLYCGIKYIYIYIYATHALLSRCACVFVCVCVCTIVRKSATTTPSSSTASERNEELLPPSAESRVCVLVCVQRAYGVGLL